MGEIPVYSRSGHSDETTIDNHLRAGASRVGYKDFPLLLERIRKTPWHFAGSTMQRAPSPKETFRDMLIGVRSWMVESARTITLSAVKINDQGAVIGTVVAEYDDAVDSLKMTEIDSQHNFRRAVSYIPGDFDHSDQLYDTLTISEPTGSDEPEGYPRRRLFTYRGSLVYR